jgi:DHA2 family methylenomycin A resistance protein-like MFS transporter
VLQPRFFREPVFASATGAVGLSNLAMYSVLLALPILWAQDGRSAAEVGLLLGVMAAAMVVGSPLGGRLADRLGRRWPALLGLGLLTVGAGQVGLFTLAGFGSVGPVLAGLAILGGGLGLATPALQVSALESVDRQSAGAAAGAYSTSRYLGSIVGSAVLAALLGAPLFAVVVVAAALAALLTLRLPGHHPASSR